MMLEEDMFASIISILSANGPAPEGVKTSEIESIKTTSMEDVSTRVLEKIKNI